MGVDVLGGLLMGCGTLGRWGEDVLWLLLGWRTAGPWEGLELEEWGGVEKEDLTKQRPLVVYPSVLVCSCGTDRKGDCDLSHVMVKTGGARAGKLMLWLGRLLLLGVAALLSAALLDISVFESLSLRSVAMKTGVGDLFLLSCL
jgi:hypothetical protein